MTPVFQILTDKIGENQLSLCYLCPGIFKNLSFILFILTF